MLHCIGLHINSNAHTPEQGNSEYIGLTDPLFGKYYHINRLIGAEILYGLCMYVNYRISCQFSRGEGGTSCFIGYMSVFQSGPLTLVPKVVLFCLCEIDLQFNDYAYF